MSAKNASLRLKIAMKNSVMSLMESRMHGDMQVRFGGRHIKTYCRKAARRDMPSLRSMKWPKNLSGREYNGMNAVMRAPVLVA